MEKEKGWVGYEGYSFSYRTLAEKMAASSQATDHIVSLSTSLSFFMYIWFYNCFTVRSNALLIRGVLLSLLCAPFPRVSRRHSEINPPIKSLSCESWNKIPNGSPVTTNLRF
ncbi:hypothetical protein ACET3Z_004539 [Daucus carota]